MTQRYSGAGWTGAAGAWGRRAGLLLGLLAGSGAAGAQCLPAAGCQPGSAPPNALNLGFGIRRVQLADLDTTTNGAADGYQSYACRRPARLDRGTTYTLRVTTGPNVDERVRAWVDFNQDGTFAIDELVLTSVGRQHAGSFTVPAGLAPGAALRLRLAADYVNAPVPGPCTTPQYSQTEDYRLLLTAVAPPWPVVQFTALDSLNCTGLVQLRDRSRNAPTSWRWDFGDGGTSTQQHPAHQYAAAGTYAVKLRACNAAGCDSLTRAAFVTVRGDGPLPAACRPATVAYCCDFGLARVRLGSLDHRPGTGAAGYQDASCAQRATLRADWPDTLRLTTGGQGAHDVRVYLDLNNDGQLDPVAELLYQGRSVTSPAVPLRVSSLAPGLVYHQALRLRLWADYAGSPAGAGPCAAPQWGQVADYSLTVLPNTLTPQARFTLAYTQPCGAVQVSVRNLSLGQRSVSWDFGDGTSSTADAPPPHTYAAPGQYELRLAVANAAGRDTLRRLVLAAACAAYCEPGGSGGSYDAAAYFTRVKLHTLDNATARPPGVGYRNYTYLYTELEQGQRYQLRAESPAWSFAGNGPWSRVIAWIDYNQNGLFEPREQVGRTFEYSPTTMSFAVPLGAKAGATRLRVQIGANSQYWWPESCPPVAGGAYNTVTTEDYTVVIQPAAQPPQAGFTVDVNPSCSGLVQLRDTSLVAPTSWAWLFGDGTGSTQQHPQHQYAAPGTYAVSLLATNRYGSSLVGRAGYVTVTAPGTPGSAARPAACLPPDGPNITTYGQWEISRVSAGNWLYTNPQRLAAWRDETCAMPPLPLPAGATLPLTIGKPTANVSVALQARLWLDANDDGVLVDAELLGTWPLPGYGPSWTLPVPVPTGAVRDRPLRLRLRWESTYLTSVAACEREAGAQVRDFSAVVSGPTATAAARPAPTWELSPNPASDWLTLRQLGGPGRQPVEVRNALGQLVLQAEVQPDAGGQARLRVQHLPEGWYVLRLPASGGSRAVLVQHGW